MIGSCIDLDAGSITYYRNGVSMGVAFTELKKGMGYFPALSLSYGEKCLLNFGRRPFEHPVEGYSPLQAPTSFSSSLSRSSISYLLDCLRTLLGVEKKRQHNSTSAHHDDILIIGSIVFEYLAPILCQEYHVVDFLYPFLISLGTDRELVAILMEWMQLHMEDFEWKQCVSHLLQHIGFKCRTTGLVQAMKLDSENAREPRSTSTPGRECFSALALAVSLFRIPQILGIAVSLEGIFSVLESLITFKQPNKTDLAVLLPYVWWQGGESNPECSEARFRQDLGALNAHMSVYDDLIFELVEILVRANINPFCCCYLFYTLICIHRPEIEDGASSNTAQPLHYFFYNWLTYLIGKNKGANRNVRILYKL